MDDVNVMKTSYSKDVITILRIIETYLIPKIHEIFVKNLKDKIVPNIIKYKKKLTKLNYYKKMIFYLLLSQ